MDRKRNAPCVVHVSLLIIALRYHLGILPDPRTGNYGTMQRDTWYPAAEN
jgi:hypothetical protein